MTVDSSNQRICQYTRYVTVRREADRCRTFGQTLPKQDEIKTFRITVDPKTEERKKRLQRINNQLNGEPKCSCNQCQPFTGVLSDDRG